MERVEGVWIDQPEKKKNFPNKSEIKDNFSITLLSYEQE